MAEADLFRSPRDASEFRSVTARVSDGALSIGAQDMGPVVERAWGDADYEYGIRLTSKATEEYLMHLVRQKFTGREDAVDAFERELTDAGIAFDRWSWA